MGCEARSEDEEKEPVHPKTPAVRTKYIILHVIPAECWKSQVIKRESLSLLPL